jgi:glutathionyl-hydroquinone reductase
VKILGQKVWGRKLPPGALVAVVREVWSSGWHTMMGQLAPSDEQKGFKRLDSQFRSRPITPAQSGRYHLYAAFTCPWAHR